MSIIFFRYFMELDPLIMSLWLWPMGFDIHHSKNFTPKKVPPDPTAKYFLALNLLFILEVKQFTL